MNQVAPLNISTKFNSFCVFLRPGEYGGWSISLTPFDSLDDRMSELERGLGQF